MKKLLLSILFCLGICSVVSAQTFNVPRYSFKTDKDYALFEPIVLNAYDWLIETPFTEEPGKREAAERFIMEWLSGTPTVSVMIGPIVGGIMSENRNFMTIVLGGYAVYLLHEKKGDGALNSLEVRGDSEQDQIAATEAAVHYAIDFYQKNRATVGACPAIERYIKMDKKGKLTEYITKSVQEQAVQ